MIGVGYHTPIALAQNGKVIAGVVYILRLMAPPPHPGEQGPSHDVPARAAGITPAAGAAVEGAR